MSQSGAPAHHNVARGEMAALALFTALALLIRLPYWQTIGAAGDEVAQATYALRIARGDDFPLVGNDAYAGPFFFYLLALLFRLGVTDPLVGRLVILITGTLTVPLTCALARSLGGSWTASLAAAALAAANPHLILLNSHMGGTTYLLPFFTTLFLWLLSRAVALDRPGWLLASAVAAGLALQSNPIAGLLLAGGLTWGAARMRGLPRLGWRWPTWPIAAGLCILVVYSPVIIYNISSNLNTLDVLKQRSYLWEAAPSLSAFLGNAWSLVLQLTWQTSGVLMGEPTTRSIAGMPLVYLAWWAVGLIFTARVSRLPLAVVLPFLLILPCFSSHYGLIHPVRFTSLLTPVLAAGMGFLFAALLERLWPRGVKRRAPGLAALLACAILAAYPLVSLFQFYNWTEQNRLTGRALLGISRHAAASNRGEPVYISNDGFMLDIIGIPYVPEAFLRFADVRYEFLPPKQIIGRLFESPGPATLLVSDENAAYIRQAAHLVAWAGAANQEAHQAGYGLYVFDATAPLTKPTFVLSGDQASSLTPQKRLQVVAGGALGLMGYDVPDSAAVGGSLELKLYWQLVERPPRDTYVGFIHLYDPATRALAAQDDHVLGRERYPVNAWQPGEVIVERYTLHVPQETAPGQYAVRAGVYTWPDMARLDVPGQPDDVIELGTVHVVQ